MAGSGEHDDKAGGFIIESNCSTSFRMSRQEDAVSQLESAVETVSLQSTWDWLYCTLERTVHQIA